MKKIFTFIAATLFAVNASSQNVVSWVVEDAPQQATPISVKDGDAEVLQIAFGTMDPAKGDAAWTTGSGKYKITYNDIEYSFDPYVTTSATNGNNKADLAADGSSIGNYVAFVPKFDGKLIIGVQNNGGKVTHLYEDGVQKAATLIGDGSASVAFNGAEDIKPLNGNANYSGGILVDVTAGKLYTISVSGSKGRWSGAIFDYNPATGGGNAGGETPQILTEVEPGTFAVTMTNEEIAAAFDAEWVANAWDLGVKIPAGEVMAENDDVKLVAGAGGVPVYASNKAGGQKISDIQKDFPNYTGYINAGSSLPQNNWTGAEVILDEASAAKSNHGFVVVYPKKDGVLKFGAYAGDNSRSIGIYRLTTMEEQDAGDLGGLVAYNNFRNDGEEGTGTVKNAAAYVEGEVKAGNTYLLLAGDGKNVNLHQISFVAGATGISSAIIENAPKSNIMYNLAGQRIAAPVSGQIYILNGKKYIAK